MLKLQPSQTGQNADTTLKKMNAVNMEIRRQVVTHLEAQRTEEHLGGPLPAAGQVAAQQSLHAVGDALVGDALLRVQVVGDGLLAELHAAVLLRGVPEAHHEVVLLAGLAGVQVAHGVPRAVVELLGRGAGVRRLRGEVGRGGVEGLLGGLPLVRGLHGGGGTGGRGGGRGEDAQRDLLGEGAGAQQHVVDELDVLLVVLQVVLHVDLVLRLVLQHHLGVVVHVVVRLVVVLVVVVPGPPVG